MKKLFLALAIVTGASVANAQDIYNNIGGSIDGGFYSWDGGSNDFGTNYGGQAGQVFTNTTSLPRITSLEVIFLGLDATSNVSSLFVEIYGFSHGAVGPFILSTSLTGLSETDGIVASGPEAGANYYDISADNIYLGGLATGQSYYFTVQGVGANAGFTAQTHTGNPNTYVRDFTNNGYSGIYGTTSFTETGALGDASGDLVMRLTGTATPEPASLCLLGLGAVALLRRRVR